MSYYFDSSVLVAMYIPEEFSAGARAAIRKASWAPYTALHELEISNALELKVGRGHITARDRHAIAAQLRQDRAAGRLQTTRLDWEPTLEQASKLARADSAKTLARSLDLLHIAAAKSLGCTIFVSADERQLAAAAAAGMKRIDIKG